MGPPRGGLYIGLGHGADLSDGPLGLAWDPQTVGTELSITVAAVCDGSPAAQAGIRAGDVLDTINGRKITRPEDVHGELAIALQHMPVYLKVQRAAELVDISVAAREWRP